MDTHYLQVEDASGAILTEMNDGLVYNPISFSTVLTEGLSSTDGGSLDVVPKPNLWRKMDKPKDRLN